MRFENWKDAAELLALVAVVGSLFAVVIELRQTQAALQAQTYQERAFDAIAWHMETAKHPQLDVLNPANFDRDNLTTAQTTVARSLLLALMIDADNEHYQYENGFLDEAFYRNDTLETIAMFAPVWREFGLKESRPAFRAEVDRVLADQPAQTEAPSEAASVE